MNDERDRSAAVPSRSSHDFQRWLRVVRLRSLFRALRLGTAALLLLLVAAWLALPLVPLPRALLEGTDSSVELVDRNGRTLREVRESEANFSRRVAFAQIPQPLVAATLAVEDKRFWRHHGADWRATLRAAWSLARHRRVVSGASTITQQLIKLAEPRSRTLRTKFVECAQALRLEQVWSKQRILAEYLNRVDYGNLSGGCASAAEFYFAKPLRDLSAAECALLAGLPQAPSRLNPRAHFERARKRQQWILGRMAENGWLTAEEFRRASAEPARLAKGRRAFQAPHFVDLVLQKLEHGQPCPRVGGCGELADKAVRAPMRTTLDLELNRFVERALRDNLARLHSQHARNGAVVIIENRTGDVLALVGSENYFAPASGQVNGAWAARSAGSTLKPFTYLLAFERGANPATVVADVPVEFATPTGVFSPVNYNRRCYGPMRHRLALANSLNISAVKVLAAAGGAEALQKRLQACGLTTLTQAADYYGLGLTIGNAEARLLELANAYACLARLGEFRPYRLTAISNLKFQISDLAPRRGRQICDAAAAYLIADILSDNAARARAFGAESPLRFEFPVACKTGTSSDFRDNWALGYTPEFTVGVWVGNFDGSPMERVSGVSGAAPVLHEVFVHLHDRFGTSWYEGPTNVVERRVHPVTGKLLADGAADAITERFIAGSLPEEATPADFDAAGRVRLSAEYAGWCNSGDNWLAGRAALSGKNSAAELKLVSPAPGTIFFLDPDLPASGRRIRLRAEGGSELIWQSDSLQCRRERGETYALMAEGRHRLTVRDTQTGASAETCVTIKSL